jgi:CelD/BcsL family acetyltransferase involved in cellulose biosynthesis
MLNVVASSRTRLDNEAELSTLARPQTGRPAPQLVVDRIDTIAGFAALCCEWSMLLDQSSERSPFLAWEWLYPWWQHMGGDRDLYLLTARDDAGQLVGIAPLFRSRPGFGSLEGCRTLKFLGTGAAGSDFLNVIVDPAIGGTVLIAFVDYLIAHRDEWDVLSLADVDQKAWSLSLIRTLVRLQPFEAVTSIRARSLCRYARLDLGWEAFLRSSHAKLGSQAQLVRMFLAERYGARLETVTRPAQIRRAVDHLVALHRRRPAAPGKGDAFVDNALVAFLGTATPLLLERGWLRLSELVVDAKPVAMVYGLAYRGVFYGYQVEMDDEWARWGVDDVLLGSCIEQACSENLHEIDLLPRGGFSEARWAPFVRQTIRLDIAQRNPRTKPAMKRVA